MLGALATRQAVSALGDNSSGRNVILDNQSLTVAWSAGAASEHCLVCGVASTLSPDLSLQDMTQWCWEWFAGTHEEAEALHG